MAMLEPTIERSPESERFFELCRRTWDRRVSVTGVANGIFQLACNARQLPDIWQWLTRDLDFSFATLVVDEVADAKWSFSYLFYREGSPWVYIAFALEAEHAVVPSVVGLHKGPAADWHEREVEDLFGITFEGHPRLGEFILHEDWPEGVNPMRRSFDARHTPVHRDPDPLWHPATVVEAVGAFAMPIGPVFSDFVELAHFLLETVGEDVIRTIPRLFYKYRGVEKIAEQQAVDRALLLAERFSGTSAFAHGLAFCLAVETVSRVEVPARAKALRSLFAELERLRHHAAVISGICNSTALAIATSQAALIEEDLLRLTCEVAGHRYLFGLVRPGGLCRDLSERIGEMMVTSVNGIAARLDQLHASLRYSSSFLDRLEEVGTINAERARSYGLVGPIARASGVPSDLRKLLPYAAYASVDYEVPTADEGDGYARLRIFFFEAQQSVSIIRQVLSALPSGAISTSAFAPRPGAALGAVEAPQGAAFHWLRISEDGTVARYRITSPAFTNWHGFHLAAENFAFQDFPIILASFGLSNAECDR